ncbi:hypothetical protein NHX12_001437 [Muraenolepis orangiensis]|uniref:Alpha-galactosidase n=1 Tax=Muraenolepis orangiensis TaxID=630683 RepID=A0A9Q0E0F8_9TELE|nr:hypothetical protein NHX12_001437 [Muraenolepis orangiensis]
MSFRPEAGRLYADMGSISCMGFPGTTLDTVERDAQTFASWGVHYLKFDGCNSNAVEQSIGYPLMSKALNATGRPIAYSCSWPVCIVCGQSGSDWFFTHQEHVQPAAGSGRWNHPDMLIIGNVGLSVDQAQAQMAPRAIMAALLVMFNDLRSLSNTARATLQNRVAIAINQDPCEIQGRRLLQEKAPGALEDDGVVFLSRGQAVPYVYRSSLAQLSFTTGSHQTCSPGKTTTGLTDRTEFKVSIDPWGAVTWYVYPAKDTGRYPYTRRRYRMSSFHQII